MKTITIYTFVLKTITIEGQNNVSIAVGYNVFVDIHTFTLKTISIYTINQKITRNISKNPYTTPIGVICDEDLLYILNINILNNDK